MLILTKSHLVIVVEKINSNHIMLIDMLHILNHYKSYIRVMHQSEQVTSTQN